MALRSPSGGPPDPHKSNQSHRCTARKEQALCANNKMALDVQVVAHQILINQINPTDVQLEMNKPCVVS